MWVPYTVANAVKEHNFTLTFEHDFISIARFLWSRSNSFKHPVEHSFLELGFLNTTNVGKMISKLHIEYTI